MTAATAIRVVSGVVFVVFGLGKFLDHGAEVESFRGYGLPAPDAAVVLIGLVEVLGGALLVAGRLVRPAAIVLAGDMVGAIAVSGIAKGEVVPSLTIAPALLAAMLYLMLRPEADGSEGG